MSTLNFFFFFVSGCLKNWIFFLEKGPEKQHISQLGSFMLKVSWCNRNKTNQQTHNRFISHYCSRVWASFYPPLSVLCMVSTDFQQEEFAKGEKSSENPFWWWTSINCGFSSSPYLQPSFPSSCPLSPPNLLLPLLPDMIPPNFDAGVWSSFYDWGQSGTVRCIIVAFLKVFISYLKCFHVHSLCFDLQKEKESSFTGGKTATCEN